MNLSFFSYQGLFYRLNFITQLFTAKTNQSFFQNCQSLLVHFIVSTPSRSFNNIYVIVILLNLSNLSFIISRTGINGIICCLEALSVTSLSFSFNSHATRVNSKPLHVNTTSLKFFIDSDSALNCLESINKVLDQLLVLI